MRLTKLKIVQRTLSVLDSDNVSSIDDTVEATQVGLIVDTVYEELLTERPWPHLYSVGNLEVTSVANEMALPENVLQCEWIKYNGKLIPYISFEQMDDILQSRIASGQEVDSNGAYMDKDPSYWSSVDDETIMFDSYDENLVSALTRAKFLREPNTMYEDTDIPDLPSRFHPVLLHGVIGNAFVQLKGDDSAASLYMRLYRAGRTRMQRWASRINRESRVDRYINYGRNGTRTSFIIPSEVIREG